jgi:hypothetical protein
MPLNAISWVETLISAQVDGPALSTNATMTSILPAAAKLTLPPNFFNGAGKTIRIFAQGRHTGIATGGTHSVQVNFGGSNIFNSLFFKGGQNATDGPWWLELFLTLRATGNAANLMGMGQIRATRGTTGAVLAILSAAPPAVGGNFDATVAQQVDLLMSITTADISSIQLHQYSVEAMN